MKQEQDDNNEETRLARESLQAMLSNKFRDRFSSTPIGEQDRSGLTESERRYLQSLLTSNDSKVLRLASECLSDTSVFPIDGELHEENSIAEQPPRTSSPRRDSKLQQELFKIYETTSLQPSQMLQRMSYSRNRNSILDSDRNSILESNASLGGDDQEGAPSQQQPQRATSSGSWDMNAPDPVNNQERDEWHLFKDISTWIDGGLGVELDDSGEPISPSHDHRAPFRILGTTADDVSCHPHVLSPPLMESLLNFVPERLQDCNFWLKFSLVRDGGRVGKLVRHARASDHTILAVETTQGHVMGCFVSHPWRISQGWYGSKQSFLWKMRHSRVETPESIFETACREGEIQVFPHRHDSVAVQNCGKEGIMLGQGELMPVSQSGTHYGYGLHLDPTLSRGSTSNSETFGNPCLVDAGQRGEVFEVANLEVWTLTPHDNLTDAEQTEMTNLFLDKRRDKTNLNIFNILVGGSM